MANPKITDEDSTDHEFIRLEGVFDDQAMQVEILRRPGVDGVAAREMGRSSAPSQFVGVVDCTTGTTAAAKRTAMRELRGQVVSVTDSLGVEVTNVLVADVRLARAPVYCVTAVGGLQSTTARWVLTFLFRLQLTEAV